MPQDNPKDATSTLDAIKSGIGDLLQLQVLTVVGDVALTEDQGDLAPDSLVTAKKIFTRIGLLDGDIKTAMSEAFVTDPAYADVRTFHQEMVGQGNQVIEANIKALRQHVVLLKNELSAEDTTSGV